MENGDVEAEDLNVSKVSWEDKVKYLSPISQPLATKKLTKKLYKAIKKGNFSTFSSNGLI